MAERIERFEVLAVAKTSATLCLRRPGVLLGLLAIGAAPACVLGVLATLLVDLPEEAVVALLTLLQAVASVLGICWAEAGAIHFAVRALRAAPPTLVETLRPAWRKSAHVLMVHILVNLAASLGLFLLVVPGIVLWLMFWVAVPATVVEGGIASALRRSHELTRGHKWRVLALLGLLLVVMVAGAVAFGVGTAMLTTFAAQWCAIVFFQVAVYIVWGVVTAVSYYHLRTIAEQRAPTAVRGVGT